MSQNRRKRRTKKPAQTARGIQMRWQGGRWVFRARLQSGGTVTVGPWREDQDHAARDRQRLALRRAELPPRILTFGEAAAAAVAAARARGLPESTVRKSWEQTARYVGRYWHQDARMVSIGLAELQWFVRTAIDERGRSVNTVVEKDLPFLRACFRVAGVYDPVPELRALMRAKLKRRPPKMRFFAPAELVDIVRRMRTAPVYRQTPCKACEDQPQPAARYCEPCGGWGTIDDTDRPPIVVAGRELDADLVEFLGATGVRVGELERVHLDDVDLERRAVHVGKPKDRGNPRDLPIADELAPIVARLVQRARERIRAGVNPHGLFVDDATTWITNLARRWKPRLRDRRLNGRTLRHSFGTGVLSTTGSAAAARSLLGHKHFATTDRYVHEISGERETAAVAWSEKLRSLRDPADPDRPAATGAADAPAPRAPV